MHTYSICFQLFPFKHRLIADKTVSFKILQLRFACLPTPEQGEARTLWQSLDSGANLPKLVVAQEDADEYRMILNEVKTYVQEMYIKFITGQANLDSDWDTYMNTLNGMDLPYATECMQKAYNAYQNR